MADSSVDVTPGTGASIDTRTESTNGNHRQVIVIGDSATNAGLAPVDATAGLKVDLGADNDVAVTGTVTANLAAGTNNIGDVDVLTVPAPLSTTGGGTEATALRVTVANNSTGVLSVDDNGSSLTVDGTVTANLSTTDNTVLDNIDLAVTSKYITGIGHGVTTVTTAGTDVALAGSTACKRVMVQAQTDNTGLIAVGGTGVDATVATGTGIILYPGDVVDFDIDNLSDIYIDSTVNGEGVRYTYWT